MKSIIMPKTEQLNEKVNQLSEEVKETLATEAKVNNKVKFTAVDMWNRQRNSRSASDRIRRWNLN
jgi:outer membrane murein-binding lipoprotein Lpp